ncbi:MAG: hypothetical protein HY744_24030 [Deltaproteobacteria bacterium]|nr:hypothetical protein [Deltaproteobacteria bacterium]
MPQLHFSVDDKTAARLARRAAARGMSLSKYLAGLVGRAAEDTWPDGYLPSVVGSCAAAPLSEPEELVLDDTDVPP